MKLSIKTSAIIATLAGALTACGPNDGTPTNVPAQAAAEVGAKVPGVAMQTGANTYQNTEIGLTITAPEGWYVADSATMRSVMKRGAEALTSNMSAADKAGAEVSVNRTGTIFSFSNVPPGAPGGSSAQLMGLTEDVRLTPGIRRGSDYLVHVRKSMMTSAMQPKFEDGYVTRKIDGQDFDRMDVSAESGGRHFMQRYLAAPHAGMVFTIIQTYEDEQGLAALDKVLDGIKLDW